MFIRVHPCPKKEIVHGFTRKQRIKNVSRRAAEIAERAKGLVGFARKKTKIEDNSLDFMEVCLISLSDILTCKLSDRNKHSEFNWVKSLRASVCSSEAGERLKR